MPPIGTANWEIYRINWDGGGLTRLTANPALDTMPVWSPDGSKIAFVSDRDGNAEIYTMNADGSNVTRLTWRAEDDVMPAWSRDNRLAWIVISAQSDSLWVMNGDGGNQHAIKSSAVPFEYPSWRWDSNRVAVAFTAADGTWANFKWMNPDGTEQIIFRVPHNSPLTHFTAPEWGALHLRDGRNYNDETWLWYTEIHLVSYENQLYLNWSRIRRGTIMRDGYMGLGEDKMENEGVVIDSGYDMNPSIGYTDLIPPQSSIKTMPEYSDRWISIQVDSADLGGSGILSQKTEVKIGPHGLWTNLEGEIDFDRWYTDPGIPVYFRSQATDAALNVEPWPTDPNGDTHTTFYLSKVQGKTSDNRGVPFGGTALTLNPPALNSVQTQPDGRFEAYMGSDSFSDLSVAAPGYADNTLVDLTGLRTPIDIYLIPAPSLLRNGEFESGTLAPDWRASTGVSTDVSAYMGSFAARLRSSFVGDVTLSQGVTISDTLHQPTLAFIYASERLTTTRTSAPFRVSVTAGLTTTQVFSASAQLPGHQLGWADLSPWAGQTITVTFVLAQTDYDEETDLFLDHITLAPWLTPVAESVTPAAFDPGVSTPITVTGQNFLDGVTVRLTRGEQIVTRLTLARLDAHTLTVDLPALGPGIYDLWVTNPGGQQSVKMGAIRVGKQSYLPSIAR